MGKFVETSVNVKKSNRAMEEDLEVVSCKKRKLYVEVGNEYDDDVLSVSSKCDESESSNSSLRSPDLKDVHLVNEEFEQEISSCRFSPRNEICVDSELGLMCQSTTSYKNSLPTQTRPSRDMMVMPSEAELEEFFAAAEKSEQKRFAGKYNYDIVKDVPLEGKYEWVRLHP